MLTQNSIVNHNSSSLSGKCHYNPCRYHHVRDPKKHAGSDLTVTGTPKRTCFAFRDSGVCPRGNSRRFSHGQVSSLNVRATPAPHTGRRICFLFRDTGQCRFGADCHFRHTPTTSAASPPLAAPAPVSPALVAPAPVAQVPAAAPPAVYRGTPAYYDCGPPGMGGFNGSGPRPLPYYPGWGPGNAWASGPPRWG